MIRASSSSSFFVRVSTHEKKSFMYVQDYSKRS